MQLLIAETMASQETKRDFPVRGKYLSEEELRASIKGMFSNFTDYKKWVVDNNMVQHGYPVNPRGVYGTMTHIDDFFGNPYGTNKNYIANKVREIQSWKIAHAKRNENRLNAKLKSKKTKIIETTNNDFYNKLVSYLLEKGMTDVIKIILCNDKTTMQEFQIISTALIEYLEFKCKTDKFV